jgi:plasmid maintenance system antidote protein VapI
VNRKLSVSQVLYMREMRRLGASIAELSEIFGKAESVICGVVNGLTYPDVGGPITPKKTQIVRGPRPDRSLSAQQVVAMRKLRAEEKASLKALAKKYGITMNAVSDICRGKCYRDIEGPLTQPHQVYSDRNAGSEADVRG